ncbi:MAG: hypothetical protein V7746_04090 [Halioglobus sp.]
MKRTQSSNRFTMAALVACLLLPQTLWAQRVVAIDDSPHAGVMVADLVIARPAGVVVTALGAAAFVVSLPFTLLGGNASDAAEQLMIRPAESTFVRCLGCRQGGYSYRDIDKNNARKEKKAREEAEAQAMAQI